MRYLVYPIVSVATGVLAGRIRSEAPATAFLLVPNEPARAAARPVSQSVLP